MKILSRTKSPTGDGNGVAGVARVERDNAQLSRKLRPGDIAFIDHIDLDRTHAEALVDRGVRAVVNASPSTSGRYPNLGPQILAHAGISIVDNVGPRIWDSIKSGDRVRLEDGKVYRNDSLVATGTDLDDSRISGQLSSAQSGLSTQLESLAANSAEHLRREHGMLLEGAGVPRLRTRLRNRPVVVVSKTYYYATDLAGLKDYINDHDVVLIGAGSGADPRGDRPGETAFHSAGGGDRNHRAAPSAGGGSDRTRLLGGVGRALPADHRHLARSFSQGEQGLRHDARGPADGVRHGVVGSRRSRCGRRPL